LQKLKETSINTQIKFNNNYKKELSFYEKATKMVEDQQIIGQHLSINPRNLEYRDKITPKAKIPTYMRGI
jgi:hypothetical protein